MSAPVMIPLPENVHIDEKEARMAIAAHLFDIGEMSSGRAAEYVGISKYEFIKTVGKYNVTVFQYTVEEMNRDIENARRFLRPDINEVVKKSGSDS